MIVICVMITIGLVAALGYGNYMAGWNKGYEIGYNNGFEDRVNYSTIEVMKRG